MMPLADQEARDRFVSEFGTNFSVIAPAGVGKTRAIVQRVVGMACAPKAGELLPRLVVVTYTNKAADEMQQRARNLLLETPGGALKMSDFNRAFFGTIHSFCLTLLATYGHYIGLPGSLETLTGEAEQEVWTRFFRETGPREIAPELDASVAARCFRRLPLQDVLSLGRELPPGVKRPGALDEPPPVDLRAIRDFSADARNRRNVAVGQARAAEWQRADEAGEAFLPLPVFTKGGREFQAQWQAAFAPLRAWLSKAAYAVAWYTAHAYREYRKQLGQLTYADQVSLVLDLLDHPDAGPDIRRRGYRIILDEAQDTDPDQFRVLLELARPVQASGIWADDGDTSPPPEDGRFSMVGDPQQSIYGGRADLGFYQSVRRNLQSCGAAEEIAFHVTFRCDRAITALANDVCPAMLNGETGQVDYVPLTARPDAGPGQCLVRRLTLPESAAACTGVDAQAAAEAAALAAWLSGRHPHELGARSWSQVAVLCPRRRWIDPVEQALRNAAVPVRNLSARTLRGDSPAVAWFTAMILCLAEPGNGFELVGVLREVFGISDHDLYTFAQGDGTRFQIAGPTDGPGCVSDALNGLQALVAVRDRIPLYELASRLIAVTRLRERLASLAEAGDASFGRTLDSLLAEAADAEADEVPLREWARRLRERCSDTLDSHMAGDDGIELITCHAAKGLEWDVVVLPFLCRKIATRGSAYPYVHADRSRKTCSVIFDKTWMDTEESVRVHDRILQESQRLLYVAMTRARRTLVFLDDRELLGGIQGDSFAACLGLDDARRNARMTACPPEPGAQPALPAAEPAPAPPGETASLTVADLRTAIERASAFPRRILPHTLAHAARDAEPEATRDRDPEWAPAARDRSLRYGDWWHGLMEQLDWAHPATWAATFAAAWPASPWPERARREWRLFLDSDLVQRLSDPDLVIHVELPFLHRTGPNDCLEGFIDLAAFDPARQAWLVVDWKTNRTSPEALPALADSYRPQLEAYAAALAALGHAGTVTETWLYSTACGRAIRNKPRLGP